jgi:hypothetical protein
MQKTMKGMQKLGRVSYDVSKKAIFYGFIPLLIILGLRTVKLENFISQQPCDITA